MKRFKFALAAFIKAWKEYNTSFTGEYKRYSVAHAAEAPVPAETESQRLLRTLRQKETRVY